MSMGNEELVASFVAEANESLADIENDFLAMEAAGADIDGDLVNRVFRAIHSIKGTCGFLGLKTIGTLAHEMENALNLIRNRQLVPAPAVIEAMLKGADLLREMVNDVAGSADTDISGPVKALAAAVAAQTAPQTSETLNREIDVLLPTGGLAFAMVQEQELVLRQRQGGHIYVVEVDFIADVEPTGRTPLDFLRGVYANGELIDSYVRTAGMGRLNDALPESLCFVMLVASKLPPPALSETLGVPSNRVHLIAGSDEMDWTAHVSPMSATGAAAAPAPPAPPTPAQPTAAASAAPPAPTPVPPASAPAPAAPAAPATAPARAIPTTKPETSLRVHVKVLDTLMNLAGELVLGRNQLLQIIDSKDRRGLESVGARLNQVTSELQEAIMQTRMQPIGTVFNKFPRLIRDLSASLGKQVELTVEGEDVELDKTIIETIGDPLTHLVRNSVDHGVERPDVRTARGKAAVGKVHLRAFHQAGKVHITIQDDGGGIDANRLKEKAVSTGLITSDEAHSMTDREAVKLIFHPGFSTAEKVTDVSGRGVGMDVVKTNIEKLGGSVEVETELGSGTTVHVKLPLTLAIIPSLIVRCGEGRFAIPQVGISELVRIKASEVATRIERVKSAEVLRLRGSLLPLVRLSTVLGMQSKYLDPLPDVLENNDRVRIADRRAGAEPPPGVDRRAGSDRREDTAAGALNIIVVETGHLRYGLIVDGLYDSQEIVVKPLGRHMKGCTCLAGATILGDGRVALILDVAGIAAHAKLVAPETTVVHGGEETVRHGAAQTQSVLLFTNDPSELFGIPMGLIARIERIRADQIDSVGGQEVLQYRGTSLPLLSLERSVKAKPRPERTKLYVVVFGISRREVGLVVPDLVDIRDVTTEVDDVTFREPGIMGSVVVDRKTARLIDLFELAEAAHPEWFVDREKVERTDDRAVTILIAEDSNFFRKQIEELLKSDGYEVVACEDGAAAWNTLQDPERRFDLVVTDIEMPNMNGYELTSRITRDPQFAHLPVIAVTSLAGEEDIQRGIESGVTEYHVKLDKEGLRAAVARQLNAARQKAGLAADRAPKTVGRSQ